MPYPQNHLAQLVLRTLSLHEIDTVVLSPGSRNAPLSIGFATCKNIRVFKIVDERVAGFFALGLAQKSKRPVTLLCTSGSAVLNYYPAIAEAFYSNIPLIVLSADRPKKLIDIGDGQTIRQKNIFQNHCICNQKLCEKRGFYKGNFQKLNRAFFIATAQKTPVHINIPFAEPLYNTSEKLLEIPATWQKRMYKNPLTKIFTPPKLPQKKHLKIWKNCHRKMILVGTHSASKKLQKSIERLSKDPSVLIFHEVNSNLRHPETFAHIDRFLEGVADDLENLKPDLVLTIGGMIVSKKIKAFLRRCHLKHHWQISRFQKQDTFFQMTQFFKSAPAHFLDALPTVSKTKIPYKNWAWEKELKIATVHQNFLKKAPFCDLSVFGVLLKKMPSNIQLHLANSTPIRYAQLFEIPAEIEIFCNRGTSGIDGSTSTAIGAAVASKQQTVFITGDLSFFYDSNALWNEYIPANFRIVLINNHGGGIFRCIDGPSQTNTLDFFETPHQMTAKNLCKQFGLNYEKAGDFKTLKKCIKSFFDRSKNNRPKLLEIQTDPLLNEKIFKGYFNAL